MINRSGQSGLIPHNYCEAVEGSGEVDQAASTEDEHDKKKTKRATKEKKKSKKIKKRGR